MQVLLKEVENCKGMALVSSQMDPLHVSGGSGADVRWWSITLEVDRLPPLRILTQAALPPLKTDELPVIHSREYPPFKVRVVGDQPIIAGNDDVILVHVKEFTPSSFLAHVSYSTVNCSIARKSTIQYAKRKSNLWFPTSFVVSKYSACF